MPDTDPQHFEPAYFWTPEERLVASVYRGFLVASPLLDKFSGWSLGVAAAGVSAVLANLADVGRSVQDALPLSIWLFAAGAFAALLQKGAAASVTASLASASRVNETVNQLGPEQLETLDWDMTDKQIHRPLIRPLRRLLKVVQQREPDRLFSLRYAVICVQLQALFAGLELLLLVAAAVVLAHSWV